MNRATSSSLNLARALLALETGRSNGGGDRDSGDGGGGNRAEHMVRVCDKLSDALTAFAGSAGFRSLLTRALTLAKERDSSLAKVQVLEDGTLAGLETLYPADPPTKKPRNSAGAGAGAGAAGELLVTELLDLLIIFIGEPLTHQLVSSAWPDAPSGALRFSMKETP